MINLISMFISFAKQNRSGNYDDYKQTLDGFYTYLQESSDVLSALPLISYESFGKIGDGFNLNKFTDNQITVFVGRNLAGTQRIDPYTYHFSEHDIVAGYIAVAHECEHIKQLHEFQTNPDVDLYDVYQHIYEYGFHKSYYVSKNYTNNPLELKAERNALLVTYDYLQERHHVTSEQAFKTVQDTILERMSGGFDYFFQEDSIKSFTCMDDFTKAFDTQITMSKDVRRYFKYADNTLMDYDVTTRLCMSKVGQSYCLRKEYAPLIEDDMMNISVFVDGRKTLHEKNIGEQFLKKAASLTLYFDPDLAKHYRALDNVDMSLQTCFGGVAKNLRRISATTIDMTKSCAATHDTVEAICCVPFENSKSVEKDFKPVPVLDYDVPTLDDDCEYGP